MPWCNAEAWIRDWVSPTGIYGGQRVTETSFSLSSSVFPVNIIPPWVAILIYHLVDEQ
jgi:hypothetical protein